MPRLVADQNLWHLSAATVCVGQSEHPRRFEWELQSGAYLPAIDSVGTLRYQAITQEKRTREAGPALFATPASFVRKLRKEQNPPQPLAGHLIASERLKILEHPPQAQVHKKLEPRLAFGAAVFILNG
jgi:hypothetical protein